MVAVGTHVRGLFPVRLPQTGGGEPNWPITAYASGHCAGNAVAGAGSETGGHHLPPGNPGGRGPGLRSGRGLDGGHVFQHAAVSLAGAAGGTSDRAKSIAVAALRSDLPLARLAPPGRRGGRGTGENYNFRKGSSRFSPLRQLECLPGQIGFYCQGHPTVHSLGLALGDRRSQYDFWGPNPIWNPEHFRGQTFLLVAPNDIRPENAFDSVAVVRVVTHTEGGQPVACWTILVCKGYKGFGDIPGSSHY